MRETRFLPFGLFRISCRKGGSPPVGFRFPIRGRSFTPLRMTASERQQLFANVIWHMNLHTAAAVLPFPREAGLAGTPFICHSEEHSDEESPAFRFLPLGSPPLGELSPKGTERVPGALFPPPSSLRSATSPTGRGKAQNTYGRFVDRPCVRSAAAYKRQPEKRCLSGCLILYSAVCGHGGSRASAPVQAAIICISA